LVGNGFWLETDDLIIGCRTATAYLQDSSRYNKPKREKYENGQKFLRAIKIPNVQKIPNGH
jgi:hypothetical protein